MRDQFVMPAKLKITSFVLMGIGILTLIIGLFTLLGGHGDTRFWAVLLHASLFYTLIAVACVFALFAAALAQANWNIAYRRIMEAIGVAMPYFAGILLIVFLFIVLGKKDNIYEWLNKDIVAHDEILRHKESFLNPGIFIALSVITLAGWSFFSIWQRKLSLKQDMATTRHQITKIYWRTIVVGALFIVFYAITISTNASWQWLMSIAPHWYSSVFGWYVFSSTFVAGMAMLTLFVILFKNLGYFEWVTYQHLHDLGKFMFAFSIFWCYLWFAQYMLIWYGNLPEETNYFQIRLWGSYRAMFFLNIIINFVMPILILMSRNSKRNYSVLVFISFALLIGHWIDFYMIVMPETVKNNWHISWYEIGINLGYIGLMIFLVAKALTKAPLYPKKHPMLKESLIMNSESFF